MLGEILIVDDHQVVRRGLRALLSSRPNWHICGEASDGIEGVEKARTLRPAVVLMDISMPRMNGIEATRIIRRDLPEAKVIIISQNDPAIARRQAQEVDAAAYIAKSDLAHQLLPTLDRITNTLALKVKPQGVKPKSSGQDWLAGGGEMSQLIREREWSQTPLGPIESWPQSLKTSVSICLASRFPIVLYWGPEYVVLYNDAYRTILGSKHPWALRQRCCDCWAEIWDTIGPMLEGVVQSGEATWSNDLLLVLNRYGYAEECYFSFSFSPVRVEAGGVGGVFTAVIETTNNIIGERRLRTLRDLAARAVAAKSEDYAYRITAETLSENSRDVPFSAFCSLQSNQSRLLFSTGIPAGHSLQFLLSESGSNLCEKLRLAIESDQPLEVDLHTIGCELPLGGWDVPASTALLMPIPGASDDGSPGVLLFAVSPKKRLDESYRTFFSLVTRQIATSLADARSHEQERKRAEALAEIDRAKTAFFSNVSHEFRTPLTLMLGPVEDLLANSHTGLSPAAKSQLELVNRNGSRLLRLVNTLLDFSRIEAGRMHAIYQPTDLAAFTIELASVFRSATEKAGLRLELDCPTIEEPVFVDRGMWEKIVLNLISNAFKFTFDGAISVALTQIDQSVELRIRDTGVGIPAQEISRLFDRFHRIENTRSRTHEGSGIGLALVLELVKLHGGSVRVESVLGEGSTFIVSLPLGSSHLPVDRIGGNRTLASTAVGAAPFVEEALRWLPESNGSANENLPADELIPIPCPPLASGQITSEKRPRILIADDNADMRQYLVRLLAERYDVQAVSDGQAALSSAREHCPDLVLTDVMMPILDGFGLLHELRSSPKTRTIPVIVLSARAGEESRIEGMEHGADDYLIKPFSARELLARVQTHLDMARVRKQAEENLRRRTEQFETLLNEAPLGAYLVDSDLRIRELNPTARTVFGNAPNLIGLPFAELIRNRWPKEYADEILQHFRHTLESGEPYIVPEWIKERRDSGVREFYEWQISRIPLPEGDYGVVCYFRDISRQVQARETIRASEERLRLATEAAELGIWHWYPEEDRVTWENERPYAIFGRSPEQGPIGAAEFRENICHPDDVQNFENVFSRTAETGARLFFQCRIRRTDGTWGWAEFTGRLEHRSAGSPRRVLGTVLDITERKRSEEILQQHRERFDLVAEAAQVGFWFCDLPFDKLIWDHRVKDHFWLAPDAEVTIDTFYERLHPDDRERTRLAIADSIGNDTPYDIEYRTVSSDGRQKWIRALGRTFYDAMRQPKRFDGLTLDITDRKQIEDRERETAAEAVAATAKFRAVFEQTPVFAGIMALDGTIIDANQLCLEACGYRPEDVLGRPFWETGWWRRSEEVQTKIRAATLQAAQGVPYREILTYHWADDTERVVDFAVHPIRDPNGQILFLHPTGIDITDLKRTEEQYRTLAETLDAEVRIRTSEVVQQSEQLRDLSSRLLQAQDEERRHIARELHDSAGQILTALGMTLGQAIRHASQDDPLFAKYTAESQELLQQLSQEIRTMSYLLHPPLLDETGLSEALRWYIQGLKERNGLEIAIEIPPDFERLSREMELVMFRLVQECLTNIHRHSGSKNAKIRIGRDDSGVSLEVKDNGKGISPDKLSEIQSQGSGVGIRGMRERARHFGGHMLIESNHNGTKISFKFPPDQDGTSRRKGAIQKDHQQDRIVQAIQIGD
jgi:PAS domain S-box-containing protein